MPVIDAAIDSPKDLMALQYSSWICENAIAIPANKSNTMVISDAIRAIARSKFRDEKWKHPEYTAFLWLVKRIEYAQAANIPINHLFFLNGEYNEVETPEKKLPEFIPCDKCTWGWVKVEKGVIPCECRKAWIASVKK